MLASQHNPPLEDLASGASQVLLRSGVAPMNGPLNMNGLRIIGLADGINPQDAATVGQAGGAAPVGMVSDFAGTNAPAGWLFCFGQAISRTTFAALFDALGTTYGVGDGTTTFNLPDCRGRVTAGKDDMGGTSANRLTAQTGGVNGDTLGAAGGAETHTLTAAQLATHTHGFSATTGLGGAHTPAISQVVGQSGGASSGLSFDVAKAAAAAVSANPVGDHQHSVSGNTDAGAGVSGAAHNNVQPVIIFNKIIKTGV